MTKIDTSPAAVSARVAHLRHVHGQDWPDAALIEALAARLAEVEAEIANSPWHERAKSAEARLRVLERARAEAAEAALKECEARLGKADAHPEVSTYWSDYEEYCATAEIEGEQP